MFVKLLKPIINILRKVKIPARLMYSYIFISILPIFIIGFISYSQTQKLVYDKLNIALSNDIEKIESELNILRQSLLNLSDTIMYSGEGQRYIGAYLEGKNYFYQKLLNHIKNSALVYGISDVRLYLNNREEVSYKAEYRIKNTELEKIKVVARGSGERPIFIPIELEGGYKGIAFIREVYSSKTLDKVGYLCVAITDKKIERICNKIDIEKVASIGIVDENKKVIYKNTSFQLEDALRNIDSKNKGLLRKKNWTVYKKMDNLTWYLICTVPNEYFDENVKQLRLYIIICIFSCLIISYIFTIMIYLSVYYPLKNLKKSMENMKKKELPSKIVDYGDDEITSASNSFNDMIDKLSKLMSDIKKSERQKAEEKYKALQAQINPHFISNTLNIIKFMASMQGIDNIEKLSSSLIQLLQVSMGKVDKLITLEKEIGYVKSYVDIQFFRYLDKFSVEYDLDKETLSALLPPFSIQPLVENAIVHGIGQKAGRGTIWISSSRIDNNLVCIIKDDGVGIGNNKNISGIGIKNVDERIKMYFGESYGLSFESSFGIYTKVKLILPFIIK